MGGRQPRATFTFRRVCTGNLVVELLRLLEFIAHCLSPRLFFQMRDYQVDGVIELSR